MNTNDLSKSVIFPVGEKLKSDYFKGTVWLNMLTPSGTACPIGNVTFEPGCRNNWHKHAKRSDPACDRRQGLLSGMGKTGEGTSPRGCGQYFCRCQTLAWCC
jgi:hypothetical protein